MRGDDIRLEFVAPKVQIIINTEIKIKPDDPKIAFAISAPAILFPSL